MKQKWLFQLTAEDAIIQIAERQILFKLESKASLEQPNSYAAHESSNGKNNSTLRDTTNGILG